MCKLASSAARDIASPAVKMGNRSLFPGVAVPLAFFCTLFFRHRKKSVSAPWDGKSQFAPESARQAPPREFAYGKVVSCHASRGAFRSPPSTPFGSPPKTIERPMGRPVPIRAGGNSLRQSCLLMKQCRGFPLAPSPLRAGLARKPMAMPSCRKHKWLSSGQTIGEALTQREPP